MAIAVTAALACSLPGIPEPTTTPRPTYTPYPTFTPQPQFHTIPPTEKPQFAFATAIPFPGFDYIATPPVPPLTAVQPTTNPTSVPDDFVEIHGDHQWFFGLAAEHHQRGTDLFQQARYEEAIAQYQEAQRAHGKPSQVLQNWTGLAYTALGQYQEAIPYFTNSIAIEDNPTDRINRAQAYFGDNRCDLAINDAHTALGMPPESGPAIHTDAEAHFVLGLCYYDQFEYAQAIEHLQNYAAIAQDNDYSRPKIAASYTYIGWAHHDAGDLSSAIAATSQAVNLDDTAYARATRAFFYKVSNDCPSAIADANHALGLPPVQSPGYHSDVEANFVLATCYSEIHEYTLAFQHAEATLSIARAHNHHPDDIQIYSISVQSIRDNLGQ